MIIVMVKLKERERTRKRRERQKQKRKKARWGQTDAKLTSLNISYLKEEKKLN